MPLLHQHVQAKNHEHTDQSNQKQQGFHQRDRHVIDQPSDVGEFRSARCQLRQQMDEHISQAGAPSNGRPALLLLVWE